jgi:nicotinate-nucleotide pyrophosphorylase (carboxylating)
VTSAHSPVSAQQHSTTRDERVRSSFYRGAELVAENPSYVRAVRGLLGELLRQDGESGDATVSALGLSGKTCEAEIRAKQAGIAAGIQEAVWLYEQGGVAVEQKFSDGDSLKEKDCLLRVRGDAAAVLSLERVAVNLLQRMSGIATATHKLVELAHKTSPAAHILGTRKTPWGLLDKRAVHCGGGGTHRLNLSDAILVKTNHLVLASNEADSDYKELIRRAWRNRKGAKFFEIEVTSPEQALEVAGVICSEHLIDAECPCILMLDNFSASKAAATVKEFQKMGYHEQILLEASGKINEESLAEYAASGVDAISVGALTHSAAALDLSAKLIP